MPAIYGQAEGHRIGVFETPPDGDAPGDPGDLDSPGSQGGSKVRCCGFPFYIQVGSHNDLPNLLLLDPSNKLRDLQIIRTNTPHG